MACRTVIARVASAGDRCGIRGPGRGGRRDPRTALVVGDMAPWIHRIMVPYGDLEASTVSLSEHSL